MDKESLILLNDINRAIIKFRGLYSIWSSEHGISYHEMLVIYTIREFGFCTQKQICDNYLLPRQTINNVITKMRKDGILNYSAENSNGREKAFILSKKGQEYTAPLLESLNTVENSALERLGRDKLVQLTNLLLKYDKALYSVIKAQKE